MSDHPVKQSVNRARAQFLAGSAVTALWIITRLLMLRMFTLPNSSYITGDVKYYRWWLTSSRMPIEQVMREYPVPVVWGMKVLAWASDSAQESYFIPLFAATMIAVDAVMTMSLWHSGHRVGTVWWILFVMAMGPLMWFRFDMVPAVCIGLAVLWFHRHPGACGVAVAVGAAIKLWPALLILPMIGRSRLAVRRLVTFAVTGGGLALASLLLTGWTRTVSPLSWQSDRGLQVEAVPATIPMIRHALSHGAQYLVGMSPFNAYEISGPGVDTWVAVSSVLMMIAVAAAAMIGWLTWRRGGLGHRQAILAATVIIGALIVSNKTLSPQYFVWWGAPVAVMLDRLPGESDRPGRAPARLGPLTLMIAGALFVTAVLTQCIYPLSYGQIISPVPTSWGILLLTTRNAMSILTLGLCVWALVVSLRTGDGHPRSSSAISPLVKLRRVAETR